MALIDELQKKNIHPMFWPPMNEHGEAAVKWRGRTRSTSDSFAEYKRRERTEVFTAKHVSRKKAKKAKKVAA